MGEIIFITGTDTGVGKTVLTALLLVYLRTKKIHALAMKPFCSGGRRDVRVLQKLQAGELSDSEMNPFYFNEPLAPYIAAKKSGREIESKEIFEKIAGVKSRCDLLLIEGAGGVMVPLGKNFLMKDLIIGLQPKVFLVGRNKLGTINQTMLSVLALKPALSNELAVVLMNGKKRDLSSESNQRAIEELIAPTEVFLLPFMGERLFRPGAIAAHQKKIKKTLAAIIESV